MLRLDPLVWDLRSCAVLPRKRPLLVLAFLCCACGDSSAGGETADTGGSSGTAGTGAPTGGSDTGAPATGLMGDEGTTGATGTGGASQGGTTGGSTTAGESSGGPPPDMGGPPVSLGRCGDEPPPGATLAPEIPSLVVSSVTRPDTSAVGTAQMCRRSMSCAFVQ